jgi:hypothetical protein
MRRLLLKKRITVLAALLIAAVTAIAAYAYFTATGSGSATATVGTSSTVTLHGTTSGTLYPGSTVSVSFTADNPSTGHQQLGTIYLAGVKACTGGGLELGSVAEQRCRRLLEQRYRTDDVRVGRFGQHRRREFEQFLHGRRGRHERVRRNRTPAPALGPCPSRPQTRGRSPGSSSCRGRS